MPGLAVAAHQMKPDRPAGAEQGTVTGRLVVGLLRRPTGEGHGATTGRRSMAMAMEGRKALEIEGSKGLPRERGIGGGHRWRGGGRRGRLSLAGGVDRGRSAPKRGVGNVQTTHGL